MNTITVIGRLTTAPTTRIVACDAGPRTVATLDKGRRVAVTGRLDRDRWTAEDGKPRRAHR